jgi:hypothetical protein
MAAGSPGKSDDEAFLIWPYSSDAFPLLGQTVRQAMISSARIYPAIFSLISVDILWVALRVNTVMWQIDNQDTARQIGLVDVYHAKFIARLLYSRYTEGTPVTVHHDPKKPKGCALYPNS